MHLISSSATFFYKRVFPSIWFGFIGVVFVNLLLGVVQDGNEPGFLLVPLVMAVFGAILMKVFVWDLVDEVWDDDGSLIVKNKGRTVKIDLGNIINLAQSSLSNPPCVRLTLREPCSLGRIIKFSPPRRMFGLSEHEFVTDLVNRIDQQRRMARSRVMPD